MAALKSKAEKDASSPAEARRRIVEVVAWQPRSRSQAWSPPTDVYETEIDYVVRVEMAGLRDKDFNVKLDEDRLIISGSRTDEPGRRGYHQMEIRFGEFSTAVTLPGPVNRARAHAEYEDGFLIVTLPKVSPGIITVQD